MLVLVVENTCCLFSPFKDSKWIVLGNAKDVEVFKKASIFEARLFFLSLWKTTWFNFHTVYHLLSAPTRPFYFPIYIFIKAHLMFIQDSNANFWIMFLFLVYLCLWQNVVIKLNFEKHWANFPWELHKKAPTQRHAGKGNWSSDLKKGPTGSRRMPNFSDWFPMKGSVSRSFWLQLGSTVNWSD